MTYCWPMPALCTSTFDDQHYDQIFPSVFFAELADLMGTEQTQEGLTALRAGHHQAFVAFFEAQIEKDNFQSLKEENARLERVAKDAERLFFSLVDLFEFGQAQDGLEREVRNNPTSYTSQNGQTLVSLLPESLGRNPFLTFREFLSDLAISAERTIIAKPKKIPPIQPDFTEDDFAKLFDSLGPIYSGDYEEDIALWHERRAEHKLQNDRPLCQFIELFAPVWTALSPHAFTQGHYYEKIGHSPSRTVAVLALSLSRHAPNVTTQNIVTALRKFQASG